MNLRSEILRKLVHLFILLIPVFYCLAGKLISVSTFVVLTAVFVGIDHLRHQNPQIKKIFEEILGKFLRKHELETGKFCGASFVGIAACINFFLFKKEIAVTAFVILAICDTAAALIGKSIQSSPFFEKSRAGSLAFFVSGILVLLICGGIFEQKIWFYFYGIFALACTTIIEARPSLLSLDDNLTIPLSFAAIMTFFDLVWHYSY